ncbi:MAG: efflux RND transporter periplasmic adaptor subunit [Gemmatimonadetes bacterium]|nr:efflux RND transporter periplasmic adaptor subunit [Gemmatimonadota bacterium]
MRTTVWLIGAAFAAAGCSRSSGQSAVANEVPTALIGTENLFVAETQTLQNGPVVSGSLTAEREATLRAEIGGMVQAVSVEAGQPVSRGQSLGRISDDAVSDGVLSARSGVRTANEAVVVAKRNAERAEKLSEAGALADRELEQARWTVMTAEATLADASARLAMAEKQLGYTVIRAPFNGVVSERQVNAGDNVSAGNPMFSVIDPTSLRLEAQVPVSALGQLKVGTAVPFTVDGVPDRDFEGRIVRINPAVDPATGQVRVTVALANKGGRLVAGLFAQGRVAIESQSATVVPVAAIDRRGLRPTVSKIEGGVVTRVEVSVGIEDPAADRIEIVEGIAVGDTVITGAARGLQPGTRVRPSAAGERPKSASN